MTTARNILQKAAVAIAAKFGVEVKMVESINGRYMLRYDAEKMMQLLLDHPQPELRQHAIEFFLKHLKQNNP